MDGGTVGGVEEVEEELGGFWVSFLVTKVVEKGMWWRCVRSCRFLVRRGTVREGAGGGCLGGGRVSRR